MKQELNDEQLEFLRGQSAPKLYAAFVQAMLASPKGGHSAVRRIEDLLHSETPIAEIVALFHDSHTEEPLCKPYSVWREVATRALTYRRQ